jgi:putative FmdB family regulatory protein
MVRQMPLAMRAIFGSCGQVVNLTHVSGRNTLRPHMPTYEYRCTKCRKRFSQNEGIAQHGRRRPPCPYCKSRAVEQVFAPFFPKTVRKS